MSGAYELVLVDRTNAAAAPPTFAELGRIAAPSISWTTQLIGPGSLSFSAPLEVLDVDVKTRFGALADARANPPGTEAWLRRIVNGVATIIAASPVMSGNIANGEITCTLPDLSGYMAGWFVVADLTYTATEQFTIAKGLVDQWQALAYGDFGIDTSSVGASGVTRDRTYLAIERHQVLQRLFELGAVDNGFSAHVNPATRALVLDYPQRGADLSAAVVIDGRNVSDGTLAWSLNAGDVASEALGVGTDASSAAISTTKANATLRASWGRMGVTQTFDGVSVAGTLDDHTQALLDARAHALLIPGPNIVPVLDVDVDAFDVGDVVTYSYDVGLGESEAALVVATKTVTVAEDGSESMKVVFA